MKKLFMLATLMAAATGMASAQMWVGGSVILSSNDSKENKIDRSASRFAFNPTVGYDLNEKLSVAVSLSYNHQSNKTENEIYSSSYHSNNFSISPFLRYHYMEWGKLRAFVDGGITYAINNVCNSDNDTQSIRPFIQPGFAYELNDRFAIETMFGNLSYTHSWADNDVYTNSLNLSLTNSISLGFIIKL